MKNVSVEAEPGVHREKGQRCCEGRRSGNAQGSTFTENKEKRVGRGRGGCQKKSKSQEKKREFGCGQGDSGRGIWTTQFQRTPEN